MSGHSLGGPELERSVGGVDSGSRDKVGERCITCQHVGARERKRERERERERQQLNHLSERVESDRKHSTRDGDGRQALNQRPRPSAEGAGAKGGNGLGGGGGEKT